MPTARKDMRCGLIGERLGHSFSPMIHAELADYTYDIVELSSDAVESFVKGGGYDAFNVTIPYKKAVIPMLDRISDEAKRIGAVNTVVRRADGTLDGYNTDYFGFDQTLRVSNIEPFGKKCLVLGSGGASLTVQAVLSDRGARETVVISRRGENNYENLSRHHNAEIIINTTPVGMYPDNLSSPVSLSDFRNCEGVVDVIYNPARTALLLEAERLGIPYANGLYMLVAQAVRAYELFTGEQVMDGITKSVVDKISDTTRNIILIGMPGCGKSTVGALLAKKLSREFFDADTEFFKDHGVTPADAIKSFGEPRFREMEHETLTSLGKRSGSVIACGGGAVTRDENYPPLHQNGIIVYLRRDLSKLERRGRPLSQGSIAELYEARKGAYARFADVTVDSTEIPQKTASAIISAIKKYRSNV